MKTKYCPSCLIDKPEEGGKYYFHLETKRRKIPMWRCASCVQKKKDFALKQREEKKKKKEAS